MQITSADNFKVPTLHKRPIKNYRTAFGIFFSCMVELFCDFFIFVEMEHSKQKVIGA